MEGSGLKNVLKTGYGESAVTHTFSGKNIRRRVCCYLYVDAALQMTLIKYLLLETTGGINEKVNYRSKFFSFSISVMGQCVTDKLHL